MSENVKILKKSKDMIKNIVLDIDETLIHCKLEKPAYYDYKFTISKVTYYIIYRPYLKEFFIYLFNNFDTINIWTAATKDYAKNIISKLLITFIKDPHKYKKIVEFRTRKDVAQNGTKDLNKIFNNKCSDEYNIKPYNTFMIDDKKYVFNKNTGNGIIIPAFRGNKNDIYLLKLIEFLKIIKSEAIIADINEESINLDDIMRRK
jgi:TFIIF-interacting CTD phosphatase-like protein